MWQHIAGLKAASIAQTGRSKETFVQYSVRRPPCKRHQLTVLPQKSSCTFALQSMGDVFSISSDTFYEPLLGHTSLIKCIKASVKPPSLKEILGENTNNQTHIAGLSYVKHEKEKISLCMSYSIQLNPTWAIFKQPRCILFLDQYYFPSISAFVITLTLQCRLVLLSLNGALSQV